MAVNNRGAYQVGLLSLGLSLALRLGPTLGSFAASPGFWRTLDEVLLYSQTGLLPAPCQPEAYVYAPESHSPGNALVPLPVFPSGGSRKRNRRHLPPFPPRMGRR